MGRPIAFANMGAGLYTKCSGIAYVRVREPLSAELLVAVLCEAAWPLATSSAHPRATDCGSSMWGAGRIPINVPAARKRLFLTLHH